MTTASTSTSLFKLFSLEGKTALVTGGAGLYGRQIVRALAEAGATVWSASRNNEALEREAAPLREEGLEVRTALLDQGDEQSILALRDRLGSLDILVNNAVARPLKDGCDSPARAFEESMRINATGLFMLTRAMGGIMNDGGSIITIGSIMGLVAPEPANYAGTSMHGWNPDYSFHKGGQVNYTRFLASYYGPRGIRANVIHPGGFQTEDHPEEFVQQYSERTCLGRLANSSDLMGIIVFLASDASVYITGTNIPVDGGYTAK
ncbi:MAG: SDR family oxidoreductase [Kiritimatiellia bacterium]